MSIKIIIKYWLRLLLDCVRHPLDPSTITVGPNGKIYVVREK